MGYGFSVSASALYYSEGWVYGRFLNQPFKLGTISAEKTFVFAPDISLYNGVIISNETTEVSGWRAHVGIYQKPAP